MPSTPRVTSSSAALRNPAALPAVTEQVNAIFEAFQDLTGQRIQRAIAHLQQVETMLSGMMPDTPGEARETAVAPDLAEADIDGMFA